MRDARSWLPDDRQREPRPPQRWAIVHRDSGLRFADFMAYTTIPTWTTDGGWWRWSRKEAERVADMLNGREHEGRPEWPCRVVEIDEHGATIDRRRHDVWRGRAA